MIGGSKEGSNHFDPSSVDRGTKSNKLTIVLPRDVYNQLRDLAIRRSGRVVKTNAVSGETDPLMLPHKKRGIR